MDHAVTYDGTEIDSDFRIRYERYPYLVKGLYWASMEKAIEYLSRIIGQMIDDGRSRYWIADKAGVSKTTIDNIYNKRGNFSVGTIVKIVQGFDLDAHEVAHLFFGIDMPGADDIIEEHLRELCELVMGLDKKGQQEILDFARFKYKKK